MSSEWHWESVEPVTWDLTEFGLGHLVGNRGFVRGGTPAIELLLPYLDSDRLPRDKRIRHLSGESERASCLARDLSRVEERTTTQHRVVRFLAELFIEVPWDEPGLPTGADSFEFDTVEVRMQGLGQWLNAEGQWRNAAPRGEHTLQPKWRPAEWPETSLTGASAFVDSTPVWDGVADRHWNLSSTTALRLNLDTALHLSDIENQWLRPVQRCLELVHHKSCPILELWVSRSEWPSRASTSDRLWAQVYSPVVKPGQDWHLDTVWASETIRAEQLDTHLQEARAWAYPTSQLARSICETAEPVVRFVQAVTALEGFLDAAQVRASSLSRRLQDLESFLGGPMQTHGMPDGWANDLRVLRNKTMHGAVTSGVDDRFPHAFGYAAQACQGLGLLTWHQVTGSQSEHAHKFLELAAKRWSVVHEAAKILAREAVSGER